MEMDKWNTGKGEREGQTERKKGKKQMLRNQKKKKTRGFVLFGGLRPLGRWVRALDKGVIKVVIYICYTYACTLCTLLGCTVVGFRISCNTTYYLTRFLA